MQSGGRVSKYWQISAIRASNLGSCPTRRSSAGWVVRVTLKYGDVGTIRRMGVLLEREGATQALLRKLKRALAPSTSLIPWIPRSPKRGAANRHWGVVENDQGREII